jgi:NAD(P)-dependent dehydrogenase (short-subunit alcohol dehydrogenase family)
MIMSSNSRITSSFTRESTADEVIAGIDLTGKRAIVTGGTSGIGVETARALASAGAEVTLAVRNVESGKRVAADIITRTGNKKVFVAPLDLVDRASIEAFVAAWKGPLHILVNNAGIMALPDLQRTVEGWEMQLATNYMGHFRLALGLHDALAAAGNARIVALSSNAHLYSPVVFDDMYFRHREYNPVSAYAQSKTAVILFAVEASRRWAADGITANAVMPGGIHSNLQRHLSPEFMTPEMRKMSESYPWRTEEQGAATSIFVATSPLLNGIGGRYFQDSNEAVQIDPATETIVDAAGEMGGVANHALDVEAAARLWDMSLESFADSDPELAPK